MTRSRYRPLFLAAAILCGAHQAAPEDAAAPKPPPTKEQERGLLCGEHGDGRGALEFLEGC